MKKKENRKGLIRILLLTALALLLISGLSGIIAGILVGQYPEMGEYLDRQIGNSSFNVVTVIKNVMHQDSFSSYDKVIATVMMIALVLFLTCAGIILIPLTMVIVIVLLLGAIFGGGGEHISGDFFSDG